MELWVPRSKLAGRERFPRRELLPEPHGSNHPGRIHVNKTLQFSAFLVSALTFQGLKTSRLVPRIGPCR